MGNDLKGNENWFELARIRVIGSRLYCITVYLYKRVFTPDFVFLDAN